MKELLTKVKGKMNLENILCLYLVIQPIIDMITSLCVRNISDKLSIGILVRMTFMVAIAIYALIKADKKGRIKLIIYYIVLAVYCITYMISRYKINGMNMIFAEIKGLIKTAYFPVVLAALLTIFKKKEYKTKIKYLNTTILVYSIIIIVSKIFNIAYTTYSDKIYLGTVGLFYAGNEIGAILSILIPFNLMTFFTKNFKIYNVICTALGIYAILELGTKTPFIVIVGLLAITMMIMMIKMFTKERKNIYKYFVATVTGIIVLIVCINKVPAIANLKIKLNDSNITSEKPTTPTTPNNPQKPVQNTEEEQKTNIILLKLLSNRNIYLQDALKEYKASDIETKILGIGYIHKNLAQVTEERKLVESDYFDIFFCHGIWGTALYIVPLTIMIVEIIKKFFKHFKQNIIDAKVLLNLYSILMGFAIALVAGHVFTAPAVSIFMIFSMFELLSLLKSKEEVYEK